MGRAVRNLLLHSSFVLLLFTSARSLATDFPPVNPAELKITSCPQQPGASAFILYREEEDDDYRGHFRRVYERIKILTEEGRKHADIEIPYNSSWLNVKDLKGRTIHSDGTIVPFEGKPIEKEILRGRDLRYKAKIFTMPDARVGDVLEFRYKLDYDINTTWPARWMISQDMYQEKLHMSFYPGRSTYSYAWWVPGDKRPQQKGEKIEFDAEKVPAFEEEEYMPPSLISKYHVFFYYTGAHSDSIDEFWKYRGKLLSELTENYKSKHKNIDQQLSALIAPTDTPEQKARKIYSFVQSLENTTYIPDRTDKERKSLGLKQNQYADDVLRQKSGDRDDLTVLFAAMAQRAGIPVQVMFITKRDDGYFMPELLDVEQLNTVLAIIQIDGKDVFLDPGTPDAPYGLVYWKFAGCRGLRQTADLKGATLQDTPPPVYNDNVRRRISDMEIQPDGTGKGTITVSYTGQDAVGRRLQARETDVVGRAKLLEDELKGWLPADAQVALTKSPDWSSSTKPLVAVFDVKTPMLTSAGRRSLLPSQILLAAENARFPHTERKWTVYFNYPYVEIDETYVKLSAGLQAEALPQAVNTRTAFGAYMTVYKRDARTLYAARQLLMGGNLFKPDMYKDLKSFYDMAHTNDQMQVVLKNVPVPAAGSN